MSTRALTWEATSASTPTVIRANLVEPEATDRYMPRPWLRWPPGAALLVIACIAILFMAAFQSSVAVVRRDGLSEGLREGIESTIPVPLPAFAQPAARPASSVKRHTAQRSKKLHLLLDKNSSTGWSRDPTTVAQN